MNPSNSPGSPFMSVHESHWFVFPEIDFNGKASGLTFAGPVLQLPSFGDWWVHAVVATRIATGAVGEMASGVNMGVNIFDAGQGKNWWTGGNAIANPVFPIQLVMGKGGNPGVLSEAKLVKGGSTLVPYINQTSGATPTGASKLVIALFVTLAEKATGNLPILPSLGGSVSAKKGESYKALINAPFATTNLAIAASAQFNLPMNRESPFIISSLTADQALTDTPNMDPRVSEHGVFVNIFDTRTTWKWASPAGIPSVLAFGAFAGRPSVAPSFFYMAPDQNLALEVVNNSTGVLATDVNYVFDGYLQEDVLGERVR